MLFFSSALLYSGVAKAQFTVYDPGNFAQSIINSTNQIAQGSATAHAVMQNFQELQRIYNQSKVYYDKLMQVNHLVRDARKVQQSVLLISEITQMYLSSFSKIMQDPHFNEKEILAIASGYILLLQETTALLVELKLIINPSSLSLNDKERMDIIDRVYSLIRHYHSLVNYYTRKNISVSIIRASSKQQKQRVLELYGNTNQKFW
ncbi:DUF4141 domain-containing protein [Myroides sp. LJL116]